MKDINILENVNQLCVSNLISTSILNQHLPFISTIAAGVEYLCKQGRKSLIVTGAKYFGSLFIKKKDF